MPDISMCYNGEDCPKKETCYRYTAKPSPCQSYSRFYKRGKDCEYYWEKLDASAPTDKNKLKKL